VKNVRTLSRGDHKQNVATLEGGGGGVKKNGQASFRVGNLTEERGGKEGRERGVSLSSRPLPYLKDKKTENTWRKTGVVLARKEVKTIFILTLTE